MPTAWLTAVDPTASTIVRASFPTPAGALAVGAGLQKFRARLRKTAGASNPTVTVELWETGGGTAIATLASGIEITSMIGQVVEATWNAGLLAVADGSAVECRIVSTPTVENTVEVGAVEWISDQAAPPTITTSLQGIIQQQRTIAASVQGAVSETRSAAASLTAALSVIQAIALSAQALLQDTRTATTSADAVGVEAKTVLTFLEAALSKAETAATDLEALLQPPAGTVTTEVCAVIQGLRSVVSDLEAVSSSALSPETAVSAALAASHVVVLGVSAALMAARSTEVSLEGSAAPQVTINVTLEAVATELGVIASALSALLIGQVTASTALEAYLAPYSVEEIITSLSAIVRAARAENLQIEAPLADVFVAACSLSAYVGGSYLSGMRVAVTESRGVGAIGGARRRVTPSFGGSRRVLH